MRASAGHKIYGTAYRLTYINVTLAATDILYNCLKKFGLPLYSLRVMVGQTASGNCITISTHQTGLKLNEIFDSEYVGIPGQAKTGPQITREPVAHVNVFLQLPNQSEHIGTC